MKTKITLIALAMILCGTLLYAQTPAIATLNSNGNIRVNPNSTSNEYEPCIAVSTKNPSNILISASTSPFETNFITSVNGDTRITGFYVSNDGGQSFSFNEADAMPNGADGFIDPGACFDANGNAFLTTLTNPFIASNQSANSPVPFGVLIQSSSDKGQSWGNSVNVFSAPGEWIDEDAVVAVDDNINSPFVENVYCAWVDYYTFTMYIATSVNSGASFGGPVAVSTRYLGVGPSIQTGPDGEVYLAAMDPNADDIDFYVSMDQAQSFTPMTSVNFGEDYYAYYGLGGMNSFGGIRMNQFPSMAVDKSCGPYRGRIYLAYMYGQGDIYEQGTINVSYSDDQGATWQGGWVISNPSGLSDPSAFFPSIAVDEQTGLVAVAYYAFDNSSPNPTFSTNTYVAYSTDGAVSWQNIQVSSTPHITQPIINTNPNGNAIPDGGDHIGIACLGGKAFAAWYDDRPLSNGQQLWQVYMQEIDFPGLASQQSSVQNSITIANSTPLTGINTFHAGTTLSTDNPITNNVPAGANISFLAGQSITIFPNFVANYGSNFLAEISPSSPCHLPGTNTFDRKKFTGSPTSTVSPDDGSKLYAYPVPAEDLITIAMQLASTDGASMGILRIINADGAEVWSKVIYPTGTNQYSETVNVNNFASGLYCYVVTVNGKNYSGKFNKL